MVPSGGDGENCYPPGWGIGTHVVVPVHQLSTTLAGDTGFGAINVLSEMVGLRDEMG